MSSELEILSFATQAAETYGNGHERVRYSGPNSWNDYR